MNETVKLLKNHRSVREFDTAKEVSEQTVKTVLETVMAAPNWINGQQVSVIEVRNSEKKAKMAVAAGNQKWIEEAPVFLVFCLDFYRAQIAAEKNGAELRVVDNIESIIIGSTDVGIALSNAVASAESLGLHIVPIGGIRKGSESLIDLLDLPKYVFPIAGLAVGFAKNIPDQKPRLPLQATYHKETYDKQEQRKCIDQYDDVISDYHINRTNGKDSSNWSIKVSQFYETGYESYAKSVEPSLKKQGFKFK